MSIVTVDSIEDTQLCRQRELEDYDKAITYPRNDLLLDIHLLRSAAFVPSRSLAGSTDRFVCPQMPASRGLFVRQPHGPLQVRDALLLGEILRRYRHDIGTQDRRVLLSLSEAARAMGFGVSAQSYTSDLKQDERKRLMRTFRSGAVRVLCAPRVLDEGVDVPEADVGVIVASSRSRRQMIQRMGRIIRPNLDGHPASFLILYVCGTTEDPSLGAHEVFLEEIIDVAEEVCTFPSSVSGTQLYEWYAAGKCQ